MNIWIINHYAYGPDQSAGTRHYELARLLEGQGHTVLVIASSFYHKGRTDPRLASGERFRRERLAGVMFQWIRTPPYQTSQVKRLWNMCVFAMRVMIGRWRKRWDQPDVILGSSPSLPAAFAAWVLARRMGRPFILEVRDLWPEVLRELGGWSRLHVVYLVFRAMEKWLYRHSDRIITVSSYAVDHIRQSGGQPDRIWWIPNGVDLSRVPPLANSKRAGPFIISYMGAHGRYNGLDRVLDAAALLKAGGWSSDQLRLRLVGEGPAKQALVERQARESLDLVEFRKAVPKDELRGEIHDSDAFLLIAQPADSYMKGGSPYKLWEYLATGRPVLFSLVGGDRLAMETKAGLAVSPGDGQALADGITRMARLPAAQRQAMGAHGRRYVETHGDMVVLAERLETLLCEVTNSAADTSNHRETEET